MYPLLAMLNAAALSPHASLRDAPLEERCGAFAAFVQAFGTERLEDPKGELLKTTACGEGNGLGGAQYSVDFKAGKDGRAFRLDVTYTERGQVETRLCDAGATPIVCTKDASERFHKIHPKMALLVPHVESWAVSKPMKRTLFGQEYGAFLRKIVGSKPALPTDAKALKLTLKPDSDGSLAAGIVEIEEGSEGSIGKCVGCDDGKCLVSLRYRFDDRFFWITPKDQKGKAFGAGWIIDAAEPDSWDFLCGVSRYSLSRSF